MAKKHRNRFTDMGDSKTSTIEDRLNELANEGVFYHEIKYGTEPYHFTAQQLGEAILNNRFRTLQDGIEVDAGDNDEDDRFNTYYLVQQESLPSFAYFLLKK